MKTVLRDNHVIRESIFSDITVYLFKCYEHESLSSCNTAVYLAWVLQLEDILGVNFTLVEFTAANMKICGRQNVSKHREIKYSDK